MVALEPLLPSRCVPACWPVPRLPCCSLVARSGCKPSDLVCRHALWRNGQRLWHHALAAPEVSIPTLADTAEHSLTASAVLLGYQPESRSHITTATELLATP